MCTNLWYPCFNHHQCQVNMKMKLVLSSACICSCVRIECPCIGWTIPSRCACRVSLMSRAFQGYRSRQALKCWPVNWFRQWEMCCAKVWNTPSLKKNCISLKYGAWFVSFFSSVGSTKLSNKRFTFNPELKNYNTTIPKVFGSIFIKL